MGSREGLPGLEGLELDHKRFELAAAKRALFLPEALDPFLWRGMSARESSWEPFLTR